MMKKVFSLLLGLLTVFCCSGKVLEVNFSDPASFRLKNGAVLKNGFLVFNGGQSHAEVVGSENFTVGKKGLTISCIAAFDKLEKAGQDLFYKPKSWMLTRFNDGMMNAYVFNGTDFIGRTDGGKMAQPGVWTHYAVTIEPVVQEEEGKYGYAVSLYINGVLEAKTENFDFKLNENTLPVILGRGNAGDVWNMRGKIAFFRMEERALGEEELFKEASKSKLLKLDRGNVFEITAPLKAAFENVPDKFPCRQWLINTLTKAAVGGAEQKSLCDAIGKLKTLDAATLEEAAEKWNKLQNGVKLIVSGRMALIYVAKPGKTFPLAGMLDRKSNREIFGRNTMSFRLKTLKNSKSADIAANDPAWQKELVTDGKKAVLSFRSKTAEVIITQNLVNPSRLESHIKVNMLDQERLLSAVVFPDLSFARLTSGNDKMVYPCKEGVVVDNPTMKKSPRVRQNMFYPRSYLTMQFGAYYDSKSGIYFAFEDPRGGIKQYYAQGQRGDLRSFWTGFAPWKAGSNGGNSYDMSGVSVIELYDGEWYEAARIYRKFVSEKADWWVKDLPRKDTPEWFRNCPGWIRVRPITDRTGVEEARRQMLYLREYFELPVGIHIEDWDDMRTHHYPHFDEVFDWTEKFVRDMREKEIYVKPYTNSRLWAVKDGGLCEYDYMFSSHGKKFAVKNPDGTMNYEYYGPEFFRKGTPKVQAPFAIMCPGAKGWQDFLVKRSKMLFKVGFHALYHDEIAAANPYLCFDPSHGHLINDPDVWMRGHRKFMHEIKKQNPDTAHDCEDGAEAFADMLDAFMVWRWYGITPVFMAVYSGRVQFTGKLFGFNNYNPKLESSFFIKAALQLVNAEHIGWFPLIKMELDNRRLFIKKMFHMRNMLLKYFNEGEMLKPVKFIRSAGTISCDWGKYLNDEGLTTTNKIISGIYGRADGMAVMILVNSVGEKVTFEPDAACYGKKVAAVCTENGRVDGTIITLGPRSSAVILLADKITPDVEHEAQRLEKYMLRIGRFTAGLAPQDASKLSSATDVEEIVPSASVGFGRALIVQNAHVSVDGSFAGWLKKDAKFIFHPVKAVPEKSVLQINLMPVSGEGVITVMQNGSKLAEIAVNAQSRTVCKENITLLPNTSVTFTVSGRWQGKLLNWQMR